jgi:CelD/BcsL family acetyltransferase involved in cellulose biosynthesis
VLRLEIDDSRWLDLVERSTTALPFHHPAWSRLIAHCYGYRSFALALADDAGQPVSGVPVIDVSSRLAGRRWISLAFTDFCPPLSVDAGFLDELVRRLELDRRAAGVACLEVRSELPGPNVARRSDYVLHRLELEPDPDALSRRFRSEQRRRINVARRAGVTVTRASTHSELVDVFYRLHLRTRRRQGVPIQPRRFFDMLWERILQPGLGFCLLAFVRGIPVAGAVFLAWKHAVTYKYGASDERFLDCRPNHLLFWEALAWSCENGFREFDFGRTDLANAGLRQFKRSWRALEEPLVYSVLGDVPAPGRVRRGGTVLGTIIRHSPPLVCRAAGELFYKYAA